MQFVRALDCSTHVGRFETISRVWGSRSGGSRSGGHGIFLESCGPGLPIQTEVYKPFNKCGSQSRPRYTSHLTNVVVTRLPHSAILVSALGLVGPALSIL